MADAMEQLQYVLSGVGLTQLPKILQGLQKARGGSASGVTGQEATPEASPPMLSPPQLPGSQSGEDEDPLAGIDPETAAQLIPTLMAMAQRERAMAGQRSAPVPAQSMAPGDSALRPPLPGAAQGLPLRRPTARVGSVPRISTMDAGVY